MMVTRSAGKIVMLLGVLMAGLLIGCGHMVERGPAEPNITAVPDFGDQQSSTLTTKAWDALAQQSLDEALAYIARCVELYGAQAKEMQASLTNFAPTEPRESAFKYWALNDVGTCMFIKGEVLTKKGDNQGAIEAFRTLVEEYGFAQCWDPKGWFWRPAEVAKQRIVELEFDAK